MDVVGPVLTVNEVAGMLRISRGSAYQLVRTGQLPCLRVGRLIRVPRAAFEDVLARAGARCDSSTPTLHGGLLDERADGHAG